MFKDCDVRKDESPKDIDVRSFLIKNLQQEPIFTAEQVLEEIEEMIQVSNFMSDWILQKFKTFFSNYRKILVSRLS